MIRMLPLALSKKEITSNYIKSFLYYVPYACLAAMTFPAILYATASIYSALAGLVTAVIAAYRGKKPAHRRAGCVRGSVYRRTDFTFYPITFLKQFFALSCVIKSASLVGTGTWLSFVIIRFVICIAVSMSIALPTDKKRV